MNSRFAIVRLALFQVLAIVYSILVVGLFVKVLRYEGSPPAPMLVLWLRDYGTALFLVPLGWVVWASFSTRRPREGEGDIGSILMSGYVLLGLLLLIGFLGTINAVRSYPLPVMAEPQPPSRLRPPDSGTDPSR